MKSIFTFILLMAITASTVSAQTYSNQYLMASRKIELRAGPGLNFNIIGEIPQGTQVYVISSGYGEWSTVQYKRNNGFVQTAALTQDNRIAEADRAAREAEAKRAAALAAAQRAIEQAELQRKKAEEAARLAMAEAERLKREAEASTAKATADAAAARKARELAAQRVAADSEETRKALLEAQRRAQQSGEIASTPIESNAPSYGASSTTSSPTSSVTREDKFINWEKKSYKSGAVPKSFGKFKAKFDYKLDNYLKVIVGKNTDIVIKVVKMGQTEKDDQTVRVAYINSNTTQYIRNLPVGEYYCVIAYGKEWKEITENGKVKGSFTKNALYEKDSNVLNYNTIKRADGQTNVPSYTLSLDLQADGTLGYGSNQEDDISNDEFNSF